LKTTSANLENLPEQPPAEASAELPVWLQRLSLVVYVVFCMWLGIVMVLLPWSELWSNNGLLAAWPSIRPFLKHGFVRGAISGLGFLDLWLGIAEAIHYRDRR
jgi:hypothetical protein